MLWRLINSWELSTYLRTDKRHEPFDDGFARFGLELTRQLVSGPIQLDKCLPAPIVWLQG